MSNSWTKKAEHPISNAQLFEGKLSSVRRAVVRARRARLRTFTTGGRLTSPNRTGRRSDSLQLSALRTRCWNYMWTSRRCKGGMRTNRSPNLAQSLMAESAIFRNYGYTSVGATFVYETRPELHISLPQKKTSSELFQKSFGIMGIQVLRQLFCSVIPDEHPSGITLRTSQTG